MEGRRERGMGRDRDGWEKWDEKDWDDVGWMEREGMG